MFKFGKQNPGIKVTDKIWISEKAKWDGCRDMWQANDHTIFMAWFDETYEKMEKIFRAELGSGIPFFLSREITNQVLKDKILVFAEHHPLKSREDDLLSNLHLTSVMVTSSLDEPLFEHFGGEKIIELMKQMGVKDSESIEHPMISSAIQNAQHKIEKKVVVETSARSQREWLVNNLK